MSTDIPKHLLVRRLSEALRDFGLEPSVETGASNSVELFIKVRVGGDNVALVTESSDCSDDRIHLARAAERLLKRNDVKCAVAVCYASRDSHESTEYPRYTWRVVHKPGQDSEWMTGGLAGLALTVTLAPAGPAEPSDAALTLAEDLSECNAGALVRMVSFTCGVYHVNQLPLPCLMFRSFSGIKCPSFRLNCCNPVSVSLSRFSRLQGGHNSVRLS